MDNKNAIRGIPKSAKPGSGGAALHHEPMFGIVKNNADAIRSGRLEVYIAGLCGDNPDNAASWKKVNCLLPFFGFTESSGGKSDAGSYLQNPSSYGMWYSPPDIGTTVVCVFVNGQEDYAYWIGCVPKPEALHMVPAIGASSNVILNKGEAASYGGAPRLPVVNINLNNPSIADSAGFLSEAKPVHSYQASIYAQQGLARDPIRGPISSSAQRESPSRVGWGVSSPGRPIYSGGYTDETITKNLKQKEVDKLKLIGRRGGHSIVMDDGDVSGRDQLVRIRTATGHQIMMSDDGQCLNIMHSNGQSWIELGKEGTIDMYATNSVNIRTQGDLNLHADNNININAGKNLNIAAGEKIEVNAEKDMNFRTGANFNTYTIGKYLVKVNGAMTHSSAGPAGYMSDAITYVNGSKINLNTGTTSATPSEVKPIPLIAQTDTLHDQAKGWAAAPGKLLTIVSRAPAHAPWSNAGQGVDVKIDNNAAAALPAAPSPALASANDAAASSPISPVTAATAATIPSVGAISGALDQNATSAMVGAAAKDAVTASKSAVETGIGTLTDSAGKTVAAIGALAQTPIQLENAGIIKPQAAALVNGLVANGATVASAMTNNLFTGKPGAESLTTLVNNTSSQVASQVTNFQQAQTALTGVGVITGNESPAQLAGVVQAGATAGVAAVSDFVKNAAAGPAGALTGALSSVTGAGSAVSTAMASGGFAAKLATGGLGALSGALSGALGSATAGLTGLLDSAKGVAGSAFAAVTKSFPSMKAGVPQNLTAIADAAASASAVADAASAAGAATGALGGLAGAATGALGGLAGAATGALGDITGAATGALGGLAGAATGALGSDLTAKANSLVSSVSSGLNGIPGGAGAISSIVNNATGAVNSVPNLGAVTSLINNTSASATNGISAASASLGTLTNLAAGPLAGITNSATSLLSQGASLLKDPTKSLSSLALSGLPAGAAAQLSATLSSLSSGGPLQIKLPTVATNTIDRGSIVSQLNETLGDKRIPSPTFGGNTDSMKSESDRLQSLVTQQRALLKEHEAQAVAVDDARQAFVSARDSLPAGDPKIAAAKEAYDASLVSLVALGNKISDLANQA